MFTACSPVCLPCQCSPGGEQIPDVHRGVNKNKPANTQFPAQCLPFPMCSVRTFGKVNIGQCSPVCLPDHSRGLGCCPQPGSPDATPAGRS